eukprot:531091_1
MTYLDEMYEYLCKYHDDIKLKTISTLREYIEDEEFDTETLQADIDTISEGNISMSNNDKQLMEAIVNFTRAVSLQSLSFNIGFTFYYWNDYKEMKKLDYNSEINQYDHNGYEVSELFVEQKYSSFKQEISHYKHFKKK